MDTVTIGTGYTSDVVFSIASGPIDPTTVNLIVELEGSTSSRSYTYTPGSGPITKTGTGAFSYNDDPAEYGVWIYRWEAHGNIEKSIETKIEVIRRAII